MSSEKLKACPFCMCARAHVVADPAFHISCKGCGAQVWGHKKHFGSEAEAIAAWNTRAPAQYRGELPDADFYLDGGDFPCYTDSTLHAYGEQKRQEGIAQERQWHYAQMMDAKAKRLEQPSAPAVPEVKP